ncbi:hypothetical protein MKZ38_006216 [Zalerion maritima]|uniref:Velvet domain-containing protein n=1 Tax=Zalerion maritima TaxID=339359 RepID=A0AAD5RVQ3_9PEZI|nr:hypothetical protein MKZ38_006216 [Zalerion maritima]
MAATHAIPHMDSMQNQSMQSATMNRVTVGGRRIWYRLTVLQEPNKARACGSGPKSTTDRRPVDPPPIIELRILEGDNIDTAKDITFTYNANFFLFTTLEHARPMANGRVNTPAATSPPVLTGMFVSGMAYLDRPTEAGYFIFPDVSVRHEGRYKFVFSLYEQQKDPNDKTQLTPEQIANGDRPYEEFFDFLLNVESNAFSSYSAKKFPGLSESTTLSRTISEQGCRVRIRRDVRMRRREKKPAATGGNNYEAKQKEEFECRQRTQTPEIKPDPYRARSLSNASMDRNPYPDPYARRPSVSEYSQKAPPPPPPPYGGAPHTPTNAGGHLHFGHAATHHYPPPPQQYPAAQQPQAAPLTPKQPQYGPPQRGYPAQSQYTPLPAPRNSGPLPPPGHAMERPPSQPHQYSMAPRDSSDGDRRMSSSYPAPSTIEPTPKPTTSYSSEPRRLSASYPSLPPVETQQPSSYSSEARSAASYSAPQPPESYTPSNYPPPYSESQASTSYPATPNAENYPTPNDDTRSVTGRKAELEPVPHLPPILDPPPRSSHKEAVTLPPPSSFDRPTTHKRRFEDTFNSDGQFQPLTNGARQVDPHHYAPPARLPGYDEPQGSQPYQFYRADGSISYKPNQEPEAPAPSSKPSLRNAPYNL